jgi:hypothetical protein
MKQSPRPSRTPSNLSQSVHHRLNMYALATSAVGVGALALARPSEAKIVYTPAHTLIETNQTIPLDLNHDGKADFSFRNLSDTFEGSVEGFLSVLPAQKRNGVEGDTTYNRAFALPAGTQVGPKGLFVSVQDISMISANATHRCFGKWNNVKNRYLGLKFIIKQKTHFGWARLNASCNSPNNKIKALLTGYAYETIPNKPIVTGKTKGPVDIGKVEQPNPAYLAVPRTATLGLLAMGAPALSIWRREESVGVAE